MRSVSLGRWLPALCLAVLPAGLAGQDRVLGLSVGVAPYDLSGTGTSGTVAVRFEQPLRGPLSFELGSSFFRYESQSGSNVTMLMPEGGLKVTVPVKSMEWYVGVGAGYSFAVEGPQEDDPTLFSALGFRTSLGERWAIQPEFRIRIVEPWVGSIGEFGVGVARTFGR